MGEPMDRSGRVFGRETTFEEAFPTIEVATISYYEVGKGVPTFGIDDEAQRNTFGQGVPFRRGLFHCSNPRCRRGGYEVDASVSEMVREKSAEKEFERRCPGDEGSPKGRKRGDRCRNVLHYRLGIKYKPEGSTTL
jgi:hypothetical protein